MEKHRVTPYYSEQRHQSQVFHLLNATGIGKKLLGLHPFVRTGTARDLQPESPPMATKLEETTERTVWMRVKLSEFTIRDHEQF